MPRPHNFTRKQKAQIAARANGCCEKCSAKLKPGEGDADHIIPVELGGESEISNGQWLCKPCHKGKSALDIKAIRKSDRARDKATGAIKPKQSIKSHGFSQSEKAAKREAKPVAGMPEIFRRAGR